MALHPANTARANSLIAPRVRKFRWMQGIAFIFGFFIQFNILVGGGGEGASATGGYGFRALDILSAVAIALLLFHALPPRRVFALTIFAVIVGVMAVLRVLEPMFWSDPRSVTLAMHYLGYSLAGLYLAIICSEESSIQGFCWGLIAGLVATVPIFVLQDLGYSADLISLGLVPGYYAVLKLATGDIPRYSGLWGHPNEAGHVAALAGAAGAYFAFAYRRFVPLAITAGSLLSVFYFTQSRGGLIAGVSVLFVPLLFARQQRINFARLAILAIVLALVVELMLQIDFIASRFADDPTTSHNLSERLTSMVAGLQLAMENPFGLPIDVYNSLMESASGVGTPHNGFLAFAIILGALPLVVMVISFAACFRIRDRVDAFFCFLTMQVCVSFMFEQLPASYTYAFVICVIFGAAFLRTRVGSELRFNRPSFRRRLPTKVSGVPSPVFSVGQR